MEPAKICNICKTNKLVSEFYKGKEHKYGVGAVCKKCEKIKRFLRNLKDKGVTVEILKQIKVEQNNSCRICKKDLPEIPDIDHNHKTGEIRGLLCRACNLGIGNFFDNKDYMLKAIDILNTHRCLGPPKITQV